MSVTLYRNVESRREIAKCGLDAGKKRDKWVVWITVRYAVDGVTWGSDDPAACILLGVRPAKLESRVS